MIPFTKWGFYLTSENRRSAKSTFERFTRWIERFTPALDINKT